jgi:hypothetical protein
VGVALRRPVATVSFTIVDVGGIATPVPAMISGERVRIGEDALESALGWSVAEEGLCREGLCVPVRSDTLLAPDGVDLAELAAALGRPLAVDLAERAVYLGAAAGDRGRALAALDAPDFALPDLAGRVHRLSEHRGKKVLLVAYASW